MVDDRLVEFAPYTKKEVKKIGRGLEWYVEEEYLTGELLGVSQSEVQAYRDACAELYDMFEQAAGHVVSNRRWQELGIPANATRIIEYTWENRYRYPLLYGRFDLAGVIDGRPAKLIEFNADTATTLPETVDIQPHQLQRAGFRPDQQFNLFYDLLQEQMLKIRELHPEKSGEFLVTTLGHTEDNLNSFLIADAARKLGFHTEMLELPEVVFSPEDGIFIERGKEYLPFDFCFKLIPWEFIAMEEPGLMNIFTELTLKEKAVILNPAYSMLFQSKGILKILWQLFPNHPYLLETTDSPRDFRRRPYVEKVLFGREGENVQVFDETGRSRERNYGDFGHFPKVYQSYTQLPVDSDGDIYQAGVYYTGQAAALSFRRRDGLIVDADAEFIGHYIMD
ncbi:glutathionylspermidine synthase family protein [Flavilitoribacter nigricans]|nr:glutathionylspermidine synthase family protein [Flavilitoribacter nigricans]